MTPCSLKKVLRPLIHSLTLLALMQGLLCPVHLLANPTGETVIAGGVEMQQQGSTLTIQQTTDRAIIHWQDFSIGHGELTQFIQPSSTSAVLNRVVGDNLSAIHGSLQANGQVFLINPNGIVVGSTGVINTAGFTASTLDVGNAEFLQGGDLTFFATGSGPGGSIVNLGRISALEGDVMLIARQVENHGEIHAPNGTAALAAGSEVLVKASGEERVFVQPSTTAEGGRVTNTGGMQAAAAELKAAGGNEYALAINNSGAVRATGVERRGGRVFLSAGRGAVRSSGMIEARKVQGGGGDIKIEAERVELAAGSLTNASAEGDADGGQVRVGGGLRGKDASMRNAQSLVVETAATLKADGAGNGNGGTVILWSDGETHFAGSVLTRGGAGGFAEVSGASLRFSGQVQTGGGTLLLDPVNLGVQAAAGDQDNTWGVGQINTLLADNNVILEADNDITWAGNATLTYTSSQNRELVLRAGNSIIFNNGAAIAPGTGAAALAVVLNADRDASGAGSIVLAGTTINSNGGEILLSGGSGDLNTLRTTGFARATSNYGIGITGSQLQSGGGAVTLRGASGGGAGEVGFVGIYMALSSGISSGGGHVLLDGRVASGDGLQLSVSGSIASSGGNITLKGAATGTSADSLHRGVVQVNNFQVNAGGGDVLVQGDGGSSATAGYNNGIVMWSDTPFNGAGVTTTGAGTVTLEGTSANSTSQAVLISNKSQISLGTGTLTIKALAGNNGTLEINGNANISSSGANHILQADQNLILNQASLASGGGAITLNADRDASGAGNIQLTNATITSNGGAITFGGGANPLTTSAIGSGIGGGTGSVTDIPLSAGIYLSGSTLTSGAGNISLRGQGIAGTTRAYGIHAEGGSVIGSNTGTGTITLHGTGGAGTTNGWGVNLVGADTAVRSLSGNISITGQGGAGTGNFQYGTMIWGGAQVVSAGAATVTLSGTAGNGASTNYGFYMDGADTAVTSAGGAISITGQGGGTGTDNRGIFMDTAAKVLGTGAASVTLNGTGGNGTSGNHGVYLNGDNTAVRSVDGNISITGQGAGSGAGNYGAYLNNQSEVAASGTGNITVHGTGGGAGSSSGNHGIGTYNHAITANSGFISLTGFGGAAGATNYGILLAGTNVTDSRIATNGAITLTGTGGGTGSGNRGVVIGGGGATVVQAGSGALNITGTGSAAGTSGGNDGIWIASGGLVSSTAGKITLDGTGRGTGAQSVGVVMGGGGKITATNAAEIEITGQGSTTGTNYNFGFFMTDAGTAVTGQTGALSITGTGGGSGIENHGIRFAGTASPIATTTGAITLTGHSPSGTAAGILLYSGAKVGGAGTLGPVLLASSDGIQLGDSTTAGHVETGAGAPGGTITLRADDFIILRQSSSITTQNQAIVLNSDRDASGTGSIRLVNSTVQSNGGTITFGGGADPSSIAAVGIGSGSELIVDSGDRQYGILLHNSMVSSGAGAVLMRGAGFTSGNNNIGLRVQGGSLVSSTSGNVTLVGLGGTSGGAGNANLGFYLQDASVTSTSGIISITGTAQTASGTFNFGLGLEGKDGTALISNATGSIILEGTGAGNDANAFGVLLSNRVSILSTGSATIQITATAGPGATVDLQSDNPANNTLIGGPDAGGNITLSANTLEWGAGVSLRSSGTLLIQPRTPTTTIGIGTGAAGTLALDAGILGSLADGFFEIIIGRADSSGAITTNAHTFTDNLRLRTSGALAVNGALSVGANRLALLIGGGTTQSAALTAGSLRLGGDGNFTLENGSNSVTTVSKSGSGSVSLRNNAGLTVGTVDGVAGVSGSSVDLRVVSVAGSLTLDQAVVATGTGDAAVLSTPEAFVNNAGAAAITAGAGRWLVYSASAAVNTFGGLLSGNLALLGQTITTLPPAAVPAGNRYVFATSPVLDVRPTLTDTKPQGTLYLFPAPVLDTNYAITGFIDAAAFGGVFLQDTPTAIGLTGAPVFSSAGASIGAGAGVYPVTLAAGTLANTAGYTFAFPASTASLTVSGLGGVVSGAAAVTLLDYDNSHDRNDRLMKWINDLLPPLFLSDTDGLLQFAPQITPAGGVILHLSSEDVEGGE